MKQKLWCYLSVALLIFPLVWGVGDTFGIVQGTSDTGQDIYFKVYDQNTLLYETEVIPIQNNLFALSITIPSSLASVRLVPVVQNNELDSFVLLSGETKEVSIAFGFDDDINTSSSVTPSVSSSSSSFEFQPSHNEEMIEDLQKGITKPYEDEVSIMPIPKISEQEMFQEVQVIEELPQSISLQESKTSFTSKLNAFFLQPVVLLSLAIVACILLVLVVLKEKRAKYL